MPARKKPITVGNKTSYTRPVTPGSNPRPVSAKPSQASKVRAAKKTTSDKGRAGRQSISKAQVTKSGGGTPGSAKVTTGKGGKPSGNFKAPNIPKPAPKPTPQVRPSQGLSIGGGRLGAAAAGLQAYNTADGTLTAAKKRGDLNKRRQPSPQEKAQANREEQTARAKNSQRKGHSFDDAFRDARRAKAKTFTWRGKQYTTEMK
jgi:hypothetical protein